MRRIGWVFVERRRVFFFDRRVEWMEEGRIVDGVKRGRENTKTSLEFLSNGHYILKLLF